MKYKNSGQFIKVGLLRITVSVLIVANLVFTCVNVIAADVGDAAPDLSLPALTSSGQTQEISLNEYRGKIVYLDFWASWCPPCLVSMPIMNELRNRLQSQGIAFEVVAVNVDSDPEDGLDFLEDKPVNFVVLSDPQGKTPALYAIKGMPTSFLINPAGVIEFSHEGFRPGDGKMIENEILKLLENSQ